VIPREICGPYHTSGVNIYQYTDDVLVGGSQIEGVGEAQRDIITHLGSIGLTIPPEKIQAPSSEVAFLGIWWMGGGNDLYSPRYSVLPRPN